MPYEINEFGHRPHIIPDATEFSDGLMSAADKKKINGLSSGQSGLAQFTTGGSGEGSDFVTVTLATPMTTDYVIILTAGHSLGSGDVTSLPKVEYDTKTLAGFVIVPQAQFNGECSWAVTTKTQ